MQINLTKSKKEIGECFQIMVQLRTTLSKEEFIKRVIKQQKYGYKLAVLKNNNKIIAVTGFRIFENLAFDKVLYVDDFVTDSENRSKGYGGKLFDWLIDYAKSKNCKLLLLDSAVHRFDAHRFYMRKRMTISAHRFSLPLVKVQIKF